MRVGTGFDTKSPESFRSQLPHAFGRGRLTVKERGSCAGVDAVSDLHQLAFPHQLAQRPADLVIAAHVLEIGAQKHVAALPRDAHFQPFFQALRFQGRVSHADNIRHYKAKINIKSVM